MAHAGNVGFEMKITVEQQKKIQRLAEQEGTSPEEAVMRLVDSALEKSQAPSHSGSFVEGLEDIIGSLDGPPDLSTNPEYMREFGQ